MYIMVKCEVQ